MSKTTICIVLTICGLVLFTSHAAAQNEEIKFSFEIDGKPVKEHFKVVFYLNDTEFVAKTKKDRLFVPLELVGTKTITGVRFISRKYDLYFNPIFSKDLNADWVVGIDTPPFDTENTDDPANPNDDLGQINYLKVRSRESDYWWRITTGVPKNERKN